jgi:hypothetical protein
LDSRDSAFVFALRLIWGLIPLAAAVLVVVGLTLAESEHPCVLAGMGLGLSWLGATAYGSSTRCPKCKKWFSGKIHSKLPVDGSAVTQRVGRYGTIQYDVTYVCKFCGGYWIKRENGYPL